MQTATCPLSIAAEQNIEAYGYSVDNGIPTAGIYAEDGLWDDDEESQTIRPESTTTFGRRQSSKAGGSLRSRSGTASSVKEDKVLWNWGRKTPVTTPTMSDTERLPEVRMEVSNGLKKEKTMSRLRGKGWRGELTVDVGAVSNKVGVVDV